MATQENFFFKLRRFYPSWFVSQKQEFQIAHMQAMAKMLAEIESVIDAHLNELYILSATEDFLNAHGAERSITRDTDELITSYRLRVQRILNQSNPNAIQSLVDEFLLTGTATILEDGKGTFFCNRDNFCNRGDILIHEIRNAFTVIIDNQRPDPLSFADRAYFSSRDAFAGSSESSEEFFSGLVGILNQNKALGVVYRLIERAA